ncbi:hypothetical protein KQH49_04510, partial [Mycetohabitans sp. B5]|uniref:hypothetical protein n=1 Tax=Mycetohabitans sp. B5 TaxID=2841846 RepID=UPI001F299ECC
RPQHLRRVAASAAEKRDYEDSSSQRQEVFENFFHHGDSRRSYSPIPLSRNGIRSAKSKILATRHPQRKSVFNDA